MARNYTFAEAVKIMADHKDFESIKDIGARYPMMSMYVNKNIALAGDNFVEFAGFFPDYFSANKVNKLIKDALLSGGTADDVDNNVAEANDEAVEEKPVKARVKTKAKAKGDGPYDGKNAVELYKECKKRGLKVKSKLKAEDYAKALIADDEAKAAEAEDDSWDEEEEVKPAKKAKGKAKKAEPEPEEEDDDDDWDI